MHSSKPSWPQASDDPALSAGIVHADVEDPAVAEVLFAAIGGDRSRLTAACDYYRNDCTATLLALIVHGRPVGVAGYEVGRSDAAALGFYLAAGFAATALGEKYPGVERFRVDLPGLSPERPAGPPARGGCAG